MNSSLISLSVPVCSVFGFVKNPALASETKSFFYLFFFHTGLHQGPLAPFLLSSEGMITGSADMQHGPWTRRPAHYLSVFFLSLPDCHDLITKLHFEAGSSAVLVKCFNPFLFCSCNFLLYILSKPLPLKSLCPPTCNSVTLCKNKRILLHFI